MRRAALSLLAVAATGLALATVPAVAATVLVGTTTLDDGTDRDPADPVSRGEQVRAQATVVNNLEPTRASADADGACPPEECAYQLALVDPEAVTGDAGTSAACDTRDYGVVDAAPREHVLPGGARLYVGQGRPPRETVAGDGDGPDRVAQGVGQLCFATAAHADEDGADPGDSPLAATQPAPVVVTYDPAAEAGP